MEFSAGAFFRGVAMDLELTPTDDLLAELARRYRASLFVGARCVEKGDQTERLLFHEG